MFQVRRDDKAEVLAKAARRVMGNWGLEDERSEALLGVPSRALNEPGILRDEALERILLIISIYREIERHFGDEAAKLWPLAKNRNSVFGGASPVDVMIREGRSGMTRTLHYLEAISKGH